jgi:hypothetical protein
MSTHTIASSNVVDGYGVPKTAGEELNAGEFVYLDESDGNKAKKADNTTAAKAAVYGMALNHAYSGQPVNILTAGEVTIGSVIPNVAQPLVISTTAGKCMDAGDLAASGFLTVVGYSSSATAMVIAITRSTLAYA